MVRCSEELPVIFSQYFASNCNVVTCDVFNSSSDHFFTSFANSSRKNSIRNNCDS